MGGSFVVGIREDRAPTIDNPQVLEWVVLANARRICKRDYQRLPNWALAMDIFGLGSTWARALCQRVGVDPDGRTMAEFQPVRTLADATPNPPINPPGSQP